MRISGGGLRTFLYINGVSVGRTLRLGDHVELRPARCSPRPEDIIAVSKSETDVGVAALFLRQVGCQLCITGDNPKQVATRAWNALWDATLLSAFAQCEAVCNFQCDAPAEEFGAKSRLEVTNYHLRGLVAEPRALTEGESSWIEENFAVARDLLDCEPFRDGIHALASFRWHTLPRARLALLWSGIEGLFQVETEVVFRVSLYASRFLWPDEQADRAAAFAHVKQLYKQRSAAVHGARVKGDSNVAVEESAALLLALLRRCVEIGALPDPDQLAP
jgi:hypothetical protein